jgi:HEAT repeat protein
MNMLLILCCCLPAAEAESADPPTVSQLVQRLGDPDPDARAGAAADLGRQGAAAKPAIPALVAALRDGAETSRGERVSRSASEALAAIGEDAVPALTAVLESPEPLVRVGAAAAIHDLGPKAKAAVPRLVELLAKDDPANRIPLIAALQGIGPAAKPALPRLMKLLDSDDFHTQYWACRAIGAVGAEAKPAVPILCRLTHEGLPSVRRNAAAALGKIGPDIGPEGRQALVAALRDPVEPVRENAVIALGDLRAFATDALPAIREVLQQRTLTARSAAARTLWRVTGDPNAALPTLIEQLAAPGEADGAAQVLGEIGAPAQAAVPALIEQLQSPDDETKAAVCRALGQIGPASRPALEKLRALLQQEDPELRQAVQEALPRIEK